MKNVFDERGESLIQFVIGSLAGALLLAFIAAALTGTIRIGAAQTTRQTSELAADIFTQRIGPEGDSATSVFIPSHDIFGAANAVVNVPTTGGVIGQPAAGAHEVDFFQRGVGVLGFVGFFDKWWCYYFDSTTDTLTKYTYTTRTAGGLASGVSSPGAAIPDVRSFSASYLPASQIPLVEHYASAAGAAPPDVLIQTGYPEVYEGNRGVVVWIDSTPLKSATSNPKLLHYVYLVPASAPQAPIVNYTWSPPPSQALTASPNITFASNGAGGWAAGSPTNTITVQELYYHRGFSNGGCVSSGGTTIATLAGPNNLIRGNDNVANDPPTSFPGEWEQYTVTPVAAGSCTVTFASSTAAPYPDDKSASVTITVASPDGPLNTLGQVEFAGSTIALLTPEQRLAKLVNDVLGGATAAAGTTSCSYAQLWLQSGAVDANGTDGVNQTDGNGCVTNNQVRLWATEAGYSGLFSVPSNTCVSYTTLSPLNWSVGSYATIAPVAATSGCIFPVASSDQTVANGGARNVTVVVDSGQATVAVVVENVTSAIEFGGHSFTIFLGESTDAYGNTSGWCWCGTWPAGQGYMYEAQTGPGGALEPMTVPSPAFFGDYALSQYAAGDQGGGSWPPDWGGPAGTWGANCGTALEAFNYQIVGDSGGTIFIASAPPSSPYYAGPVTDLQGTPPGSGVESILGDMCDGQFPTEP